jgi:hypothetical protein
LYKEHFAFKKPRNEDIAIWRYMDFTKFVSLLDKAALFFVRSDKLEDAFEGSYPRKNLDIRKNEFEKVLGECQIESDPLEIVDVVSQQFKRLRYYIALNCWNISDQESAALWKLYLKSNEGIAIRSSFRRLKTSFNSAVDDIYIGTVRYLDYNSQTIPETNLFYPFLSKRKSFEYEHELRALLYSQPSMTKNADGKLLMDIEKPHFENGKYVPVNLKELIHQIYLAPTCSNWLKELVESIVELYGIEVQVVRSSLDDSPIY